MKRSRRRTSQILFWILSLLVVLSMAVGLTLSVIPAPEPPAATPGFVPFSFAVCGDFAAPGERIHDASAFSQLLRRVAEDGNSFLIHTGNLVRDGSQSGFQEFAALMANSPLPLYPLPGHRDYDQGVLDNFLRYSGAPGVHYSFDYGSVHFALANSGLGDMTAEELAWVQADLAASEQPVRMVFLHYPPFHPVSNGDVMRSGGEEFVDLMEDQAVQYVFAGHIPGYHAQDRNGVHYIITGGPGAPPDQEAGKGGPIHYVRVTVEGTEVIVKVVPLGE